MWKKLKLCVHAFHMYPNKGDRRLGILFDNRGGSTIEIGLWKKSYILDLPYLKKTLKGESSEKSTS